MISYIDPYIFQSLLPETQAIIDRAVLESFTLPNNNTINHINSLIKELKDIGYWQIRDLFFNFAYNDINLVNFSRINWINPSGTLATIIGSPNYLTTGTQGVFTGTDYIDSNWNYLNDSNNYTLDDASIEVIISDSGASGSIYTSAENLASEVIRSAGSNHRINQGTTNTTPNSGNSLGGTGYTALNRVNSTDVIMVKLATIFNTTANSTILQNRNLLLHKSSGTLFGSATISAVSTGANTLSIAQDFRTAYNKYLTNIGLSPVA